jgi:D-alanyl-D-alanine carboxypeptidase
MGLLCALRRRPLRYNRAMRDLRPRLLAALAALLALASLSPGSAQTAGLSSTLTTMVGEAGLGEQVSITVADAISGTRIFEHNPDLQLNPASNQKLVTAAAALSILGAETRFRTGLYGRVEGSAVVGGLVLRGMGDPSLHQSDLAELARDLERRGVRSVDEIVVDATYFDAQMLPPAFDQQPNEVAPFRAATGAISVDVNAYVLRVRPGDTVGAGPRASTSTATATSASRARSRRAKAARPTSSPTSAPTARSSASPSAARSRSAPRSSRTVDAWTTPWPGRATSSTTRSPTRASASAVACASRLRRATRPCSRCTSRDRSPSS